MNECNSTYARVVSPSSSTITRRGTKRTCNLNERWTLARRHNCSARIPRIVGRRFPSRSLLWIRMEFHRLITSKNIARKRDNRTR